MKTFARISWKALVTVFFTALFYLFTITSARAPQGDKHSLGARTIASVQEEDFDQKMLRLQACYGVRLTISGATQDRRRACKAILVRKLNEVLAEPGAHFSVPIQFRCQETSVGQSTWKDLQNHPVYTLKPNEDLKMIELAIKQYLEHQEIDMITASRAQEACDFLLSCRKAMSFRTLSFRRIASCIFEKDPLRRRITADSINSLVFHVNPPEELLVADILRGEN